MFVYLYAISSLIQLHCIGFQIKLSQFCCTSNILYFLALENLGFQSYLSEVKDCVSEAKEVAQKKRRQSTKLENLGIPEEELLRQQQELFAKVSSY